MALPQLVGLRCVWCGETISSIKEGSFCRHCGNPAHDRCVRPGEAGMRDGLCACCGGDPQLAPPEVRQELGLPVLKAPAAGPRLLAEFFVGGRVARVLLSAGVVASLFACALAILGIFTGLASVNQLRRLGGSPMEGANVLVVVNGVLQSLLWLGLAVVFGRVIVAADLAGEQDAENRRLWQAIRSLQAGNDKREVGLQPAAAQEGLR